MFNFVKYIIALVKGFAVTFKHIFKPPTTDRYPKKKREMLPRYRGLHYLVRYEDGKERCVCCGLCAAACPVECIYMEGEENEKGERRAKVYEINELRCIFCGYCEEACPESAIFLGREYEFTYDNRISYIYDKEKLLSLFPTDKKNRKKIIGGEID
jgi:NADH-quinone oxidoreductase subunit I